jgi:hypothetical protein
MAVIVVATVISITVMMAPAAFITPMLTVMVVTPVVSAVAGPIVIAPTVIVVIAVLVLIAVTPTVFTAIRRCVAGKGNAKRKCRKHTQGHPFYCLRLCIHRYLSFRRASKRPSPAS